MQYPLTIIFILLRSFNYIRHYTKIMLLVMLIITINAKPAAAGWDSCIDDNNLLNDLLGAVGTLGVSLIIESGFSMKSNEDCEGEKASGKCSDINGESTPSYPSGNSNGAVCDDNNKPVIRCNTPVMVDKYSDPNYTGPYTNDLRFKMNGAASFFIGMWSGSTKGCDGNILKGYTCRAQNGYTYGLLKNIRVTVVGDRLCVQYWSFTGWQTLGCKYMVPPPEITFMAGCYVGTSCTSLASRYSLSFFPITGALMQCVRETIFKVFVDPASCAGTNGMNANLFPTFQNNMRKIVQILVALTIIIFGIKIALGGNIPKNSEIFIFIIKIILVAYFAVGIYNSDTGRYEDGLTKHIIPGFVGAANDLSNMMFQAGGSQGLCKYNVSEYKSGYSYLALWDALDCRIAYYLGFNNASNLAGVGLSLIFSFIIPALFSFQIIFAVFCILFSIFVISIAVYFVHTFIIALIALSIISYLGPIFIPMALFGITRSYFDAWLKLMFSFALQPVVISAFMALMLTIFDQIFYGSCTWKTIVLPLTKFKFFVLNPSLDPACINTFGYNMDLVSKSNSILEFTALFFKVSILNISVMVKLIKGMLAVTLFAYLFYSFGKMLSGFAAEVSGGPSLGAMAVSPNAVVDAAIDLAMKYADAKTGGAASKAKGGVEAAGGDGSDSRPRTGGVSATSSGGDSGNKSSGSGSGISAASMKDMGDISSMSK
ncbi:Type IV secretion system protein virB6 [Rickettsiales bacterium Ac37b]|nr:Type IV secretion system protein virB6 [Rickettsiales bacterium Ac37b]